MRALTKRHVGDEIGDEPNDASENDPQAATDHAAHGPLQRRGLTLLGDGVDIVRQVGCDDLEREAPIALTPEIDARVDVDRPVVRQIGKHGRAAIVVLLTGRAASILRNGTYLKVSPRVLVDKA